VVYDKVAELRGLLEAELQEMDNSYRQMEADLRGLDGKTAAAFAETMRANQEKARTSSEVLQRLLAFIDLSAKQYEHEEQLLKNVFALAKEISSGGSSTAEGGSK